MTLSLPDTTGITRSGGWVCPSSFPYLLTLRGKDITRDLLLYPLKSTSITIGRHVSDHLGSPRAHSDSDIPLFSDDVQQVHCRLVLRPLEHHDASESPPARDGEGGHQRYCYYLEVGVLERAAVFVNGLRVVESSGVVRPGDVLGVGYHYLFLYKDPTRGYDIPATLPWYCAGPSDLYARVNKAGARQGGGGGGGGGSGGGGGERIEQQDMMMMTAVSTTENKESEYSELDFPENTDRYGEGELTVPYPRDREGEVLDYITTLSCPQASPSSSSFPLSTTLLLLGCHGYADRHFPPDHQAGFFRRLLSSVRHRVSMVSKKLSALKYQTNLYSIEEDTATADDLGERGDDPLLDLMSWLSNTVRLFSHLTSAHFRSRLVAPQCAADVTESALALCDGIGETITFMFQQAVYCITKVLYGAVVQILQPETTPSSPDHSARAMSAVDRLLGVLCVTLDVSEDLSLHHDVTIQMMMYLLFFVNSTLCNKLLTKGGESQHLYWSMGVRLQSVISCVENWVSTAGLEAPYLRVSEPLVSLVDLLATSPHSLLTMQWSELRAQYRALSESQLIRVLSQYRFSDDRPPPPSWRPPPDTPLSEEVTISLTSHPPFVLPQHGVEMDLKPPFPPAFHTHLHDIITRFSPSAGAHGQTSFSTGYGHHHSPSTAQPPSHLNLPLPPGPHGTFFSTSISSPTATILRTDFTHHHMPSEPSHCSQHNNSAQEIRSPPLPQRNRDPGRDSKSPPPPPLPPRRPSRTCITSHNSGDPSWQELSNHREQSESRSSAAGPPQNGFNGGNLREHVSGFTAHDSGTNSFVGCGSKAEEERTDKKRKDSGVSNKDVKIGEVLEHSHVPESARMPPVVEATIQSSHVPQNEKLPSLCSALRDTHSSGTNGYNNNNNNNSGSNHTTITNNRFQFEDPPPSPATARLSISKKLLPSGSAQQDPATAAKTNSAPRQRSVPQEPPNERRRSQDLRMLLPELKARDPRRRPLSGTVLSSGTGLTLQDKRILNQVPGLDIPSETVSLVSESAISDDVFVHSSAGVPASRGGLRSSAQVAEFRRFSTGMLSQTSGTGDGEEREGEDRPRVVRVEMREGVSPGQLTADQCPAADDIYIDVVKEMARVKGREGSAGGILKMLPHEDNGIVSKTSVNCGQGSSREDARKSGSSDMPRVMYRHTMPQERDLSTKGEITGEVFTLSLLKEGARLGMGLVDGLYTPLKLPGIYVRNVLAGTPAALCGHIRVGDRILAVNGRSIVGSDYTSAMKLIRSAGPRLNLLVAKCDRSVTALISAS